MENVVTLHGLIDVATVYPFDQQAEAISLWQQYVADGKRASLTVATSHHACVFEEEVRPDFENMTAEALSAWYIKSVGYDIGAEDPDMSLESYRELCVEVYELQNEV